MDRVKNKVAVVTGASLGIGRATAIRLAEEGAYVAVTDVLDAAGARVVSEIDERGGDAAFWHLDVSKEAEVKRVMSEVAAKWGKIDILVNNAGISGANKPTDQLTEQEWAVEMSGQNDSRLFRSRVNGSFEIICRILTDTDCGILWHRLP